MVYWRPTFRLLTIRSNVLAASVHKRWYGVDYTRSLDTIISPQKPIGSNAIASSVHKRWYGVDCARPLDTVISPQKPCALMFRYFGGRPTEEDINGIACVYDSGLDNWFRCVLPEPTTGIRYYNSEDFYVLSASCGLVATLDSCGQQSSDCFPSNDNRQIHLCNPVTGDWKYLPPYTDHKELENCVYLSSLALSVNPDSGDYMLAVVRVTQGTLEGDVLSIYRCESATQLWSNLHNEVMCNLSINLDRHDVLKESVICNGVLYCMLTDEKMIMYNLVDRSSNASSLLSTSIELPTMLTEPGGLTSFRGRLVVACHVKHPDEDGSVTGISILELVHGSWHEVARKTYDFCSECQFYGVNDHIFIRGASSGENALLIYDLTSNQFRLTRERERHVYKISDYDLFSYFCFEPRLDIAP